MKLKILLVNEEDTTERFELTPVEAFQLSGLMTACIADSVIISEKEETAVLALHVSPNITTGNRNDDYHAAVEATQEARAELKGGTWPSRSTG